MSRSHKPDPYNGFKNDVERRRALNVRIFCICMTIIGVAYAPPGSLIHLQETLHWLIAVAARV